MTPDPTLPERLNAVKGLLGSATEAAQAGEGELALDRALAAVEALTEAVRAADRRTTGQINSLAEATNVATGGGIWGGQR